MEFEKSDSDAFKYVEKLEGSRNYSSWAFVIRRVLKDRDLWYVVDPQESADARTAKKVESSTTGKSSQLSEVALWAAFESVGSTADADGKVEVNTKHLQKVLP